TCFRTGCTHCQLREKQPPVSCKAATFCQHWYFHVVTKRLGDLPQVTCPSLFHNRTGWMQYYTTIKFWPIVTLRKHIARKPGNKIENPNFFPLGKSLACQVGFTMCKLTCTWRGIANNRPLPMLGCLPESSKSFFSRQSACIIK